MHDSWLANRPLCRNREGAALLRPPHTPVPGISKLKEGLVLQNIPFHWKDRAIRGGRIILMYRPRWKGERLTVELPEEERRVQNKMGDKSRDDSHGQWEFVSWTLF